MRLVRFAAGKELEFRPGLLDGDRVVDLSPRYASVASFVSEHPEGWDAPALRLDGLARIPLSEVRLGPPVDRTAQFFFVAANYKKHAEEAGVDVPPHPVLFTKPHSALVGPDEPITLPGISQKMDYEGELAAVMGRTARRIRAEEAPRCVAGYTVVNDVTARDLQWTQLGQNRIVDWLSSKCLDRTTPVGPWIVSARSIRDPHDLRLTTHLNGVLMQDASTSLMVFSIWKLLEFLSARITLQPGDVLATGTPFGVGGFRDIFLRPGDVVRVEIEGIGVLENRGAREEPAR